MQRSTVSQNRLQNKSRKGAKQVGGLTSIRTHVFSLVLISALISAISALILVSIRDNQNFIIIPIPCAYIHFSSGRDTDISQSSILITQVFTTRRY